VSIQEIKGDGLRGIKEIKWELTSGDPSVVPYLLVILIYIWFF